MSQIALSPFIQTKPQANDFSARLATIAEQTFQTNFNLEKALMTHFGIEKKDKFIALLRENNVGVDSLPALKTFLLTIQEQISNLSVLPITLAFEPKEQTLTTLSDWFFLNLKKQVLFDIHVDRKLVGGAAITFNGKYIDLSIKAQFDGIVKKILEQTASPVEKKG